MDTTNVDTPIEAFHQGHLLGMEDGRTAALNEVREIADGLLYNTEDGKELDPIQELKDRLTNLEKGK